MLFYAYTLLSLQLKSELTTKLAKILEDKGVLSDFISNFAVENRAEELALYIWKGVIWVIFCDKF